MTDPISNESLVDAIERARLLGENADNILSAGEVAAMARELQSLRQSSVNVKPLEWVDLGDGKAFRAFLPVIGAIRIEPYGVCGWWEVLWSMPGQCDKLIPDVFDTADEAKAAAQADYERRVLSCLTVEPEGVASHEPTSGDTQALSPSTDETQEPAGAEPVAWPLSAALKQAEAYISEYEFDDCDGGYHSPTDFERQIMVDMVNGLFSEDAFVSTICQAFASPPKAVTISDEMVEAAK